MQDFSYDCWVIDQLSEGVVPLFMPAAPVKLTVVADSFTFVATQVAAARAQLSVEPNNYPLSGPDTLISRPEWFTPAAGGAYTRTGKLDTGLGVQKAGDVATTKP